MSGMDATKTTRAGTLNRGSLSARYAFIASASVSSTESASSASSRRRTNSSGRRTRRARRVVVTVVLSVRQRPRHARAGFDPGVTPKDLLHSIDVNL